MESDRDTARSRLLPKEHHLPEDSTRPSALRPSLKMESLRSFGHWIANSYRAAAIIILNTLVLLICLELTARSAIEIRNFLPKSTEPLIGEGTPRETVSYYASQDWAKRYWYEFRLARKQRYYPFVGWRRAPFKGKTIEIDQNGVRMTPGADCKAKSFKVFTFGESTMWGTGSPDWGTIPAFLQKGFEKLRGGPVCVINFAESAYVSTQDVIMLLEQLRSGNVPDLVVFYSIGGDIGAAYESGRAGIHASFDQIAPRFEGRRESAPLLEWLRRTAAYSVIDRLMSKLTTAGPKQKESGQTQLLDRVAPTPGEVVISEKTIDVGKLSDLVVQDYFGNYKIVNALSRQYGFKTFFFLPPVVALGNKPLTREEQEMKDRLKSDTVLDKLFAGVYQAIERESSGYRNVYSLVHIFDRYEELVWIDEGHVTPIGNQLIAQRMLDIIETRSPEEK